jgi:hypothetical protein
MFLLGGLEEKGGPIFSTRVLLYIDEIDSTKNCRKDRLAVYTRCQKWKGFKVLRSFPNFFLFAVPECVICFATLPAPVSLKL